MKKLLSILVVMVILVIGGLSAPVFALDTGVISVTAEVAQISVSVNPDTITYGLVPLATIGVQPSDNPTIFAFNTSNCFVDMQIKGAHTTDWTLDTAPGADTYVHYFGQPFFAPSYTPLGTDYNDLGTWESYSPGSIEMFLLQMDTPTSSSSFEMQATTVTVLVTYEEEGIKALLDANGPYTAGSANVTVTANVTDQDNSPVTGLTADKFSTAVFSGTPPNMTIILDPVLTTTWVENGGGIYTGTITDISTLLAGDYWASVNINDGLHFAGSGDGFDIVP